MEDCTIILSILAGIFAIYYYYLSSRGPNVFQQHGIPHKKPSSLYGYIMENFVFPKSVVDHTQSLYTIHSDAKYVGMFGYTTPVVVIRDIELLKSIAIKNFDSFHDHIFTGASDQDKLFGNNLVALRGDKWRNARSQLSPAFTSSKMKMMFQLMSECAANFADNLMNLPSEKKMMEMKDVITKYTTDVIAACAFGISVDSIKNPENDFYKYGKKAANSINKIAIIKMMLHQRMPWLTNLLKLKMTDEDTNAFFTNLVGDTIKVRDEKNITRPDMLQQMMDSRRKGEPGKEMTIEDITSQAFIFFLGGFDSPATVMSFMLYEIAINPDIQEKLRGDIDKVLKDTNGQPSYEAINGMAYLGAVINESLRVYPPNLLQDRQCVKDFELPAALPGAKPYTVKKGKIVLFPYGGFLRDPKYFPDEPNKFKPERFLDGKDQYNPDAFVPFGIGPRMCIGNRFALLEMKVLLFHLLARCELKTCEKTPIPLKYKKGVFTVTAEGGLWLKIVPRENRPSIFTDVNQGH